MSYLVECILVICVVSLHLLVPQHHCRSSSQACALGCLKTGTIPGQRAQHRPVWRMTRRQRSRKGRSPARWKRSECWEVSSGRGASRQMCRILEQHSPLAVKITIMVNHGHKSFFTKQQKKKNQNCFGLITDIFAIVHFQPVKCGFSYADNKGTSCWIIFKKINHIKHYWPLRKASTFLEQHLKQILMPISSEV